MDDALPQEERVINPMLYNALRQRFGRVIVANRGAQPAPAFPSAFATRDGSMKIGTDRSSWGEYYRVCCPYCVHGDSNFHLWVNHLYGTNDDQGRALTHLAVCYKGCLANNANRLEFFDSILGLVNRNARGHVVLNPGDESADILAAVKPPGKIMSIAAVSPQNAARMYLVADRGFDVDWLAKNYEVGVVMDVDNDINNTMLGRVYIPIRMDGMLVGWQGRWPGDRDMPGRPKYYNLPNMPKKLMLYNWHIAKHWPFLCLAEGILSAWRVAEPCCALLGPTISIPQRQLIRECLGKPIFLMVESESLEQWQEIEMLLRQDGHQTVIPIVFPKGFDPANYEHSVVAGFIRNAAAQRNLQIADW